MSPGGGQFCSADYKTFILLCRDLLSDNDDVVDAVDADDDRSHHPQDPSHQAGIGDGGGNCENPDTKGPFDQVNHRLQVGDGFVLAFGIEEIQYSL